MEWTIIDAHAHCGLQDRFPPQSLEDYLSYVWGSGIRGAVMFSPVIEIYDRNDFHFHDTEEWQERRKRSNEYLVSLHLPDFTVYPYFFIWNDFAVEQLTECHRGIKWHRHSDEPCYHYDDPRCRRAIEEIRRRNLPVLLEEELHHTVRFIEEIAVGVRVIIPHLGGLNGGYERLRARGIWDRPHVYADTSLASPSEILDYIGRFGHERLMFGSDFPFGDPQRELKKVLQLPLEEDVKRAVAGLNVQRLLLGSDAASG